MSNETTNPIAGPNYCAISAEDGLYLRQIGQVDGHRLSERFAAVWSRIPESRRQALLSYWRKDGQDDALRPWILLTTMKAPNRNLSMAWVASKGNSISFQSFAIDIMPDEILDSLIAYQLSVVKLHTEAEASNKTHPDLGWRRVDEVMKSWGFKIGPFFRWKNENQDRVRAREDLYNGIGGYLEDTDD